MAILASAVILALLACLFTWWAQPLWRLMITWWKLKCINGPASSSLILGNLPDMVKRRSFWQHYLWMQEYGTIYKLRFLYLMGVVCADPDIYSKVLKPGPSWMPKHTKPYRSFEMFTFPHLPNILSSPDNEYWKAVRRTVAPAFAMTNMKKAFPHVLSITGKVVEMLKSGGQGHVVDVDDLAQRMTMDILGQFGFGHDFGSVVGGETAVMLQVVERCLIGIQARLNPFNRWFPTKAARELKKWTKEFDRLMTSFVKDFLKRAQSGAHISEHSLLAHLLNCVDPATGKTLNMSQLKAETSIFLMAGYETTAHTIAWTIFLLATHPEIEARLVEELDSLGLVVKPGQTSPARNVTWDDLSNVPFLNACINESMRIVPVVPVGTSRKASRDMQVGPMMIPEGCVFLVPFFALHHQESIWPNSWKYDPDRWLKGKPAGAGEVSDRVRGFLPFSDGPRNCVGQALALLELRVVLATLYGHFSFKLVEDMDLKTAVAKALYAVTLKPKNVMVRCYFRGQV